jgi:hypothetical protein
VGSGTVLVVLVLVVLVLVVLVVPDGGDGIPAPGEVVVGTVWGTVVVVVVVTVTGTPGFWAGLGFADGIVGGTKVVDVESDVPGAPGATAADVVGTVVESGVVLGVLLGATWANAGVPTTATSDNADTAVSAFRAADVARQPFIAPAPIHWQCPATDRRALVTRRTSFPSTKSGEP